MKKGETNLQQIFHLFLYENITFYFSKDKLVTLKVPQCGQIYKIMIFSRFIRCVFYHQCLKH